MCPTVVVAFSYPSRALARARARSVRVHRLANQLGCVATAPVLDSLL